MTENGQPMGEIPREAPVGGWLFLLLTAAGALLLLLGSNALTGIEGDAAEGCRRLLGEYDSLAPNGWYPDSIRTLAYSRLLKPFVLLWGKSELVLRLPSVIFALLLLIGTGALTFELFQSSRTALLSGWLLLGSYGFLFWGRCAHPAMLESCCILWGAVMLYGEMENYPFLKALIWLLQLLILWIFNGLIGMTMLVLMTVPVWIREWKGHRFESPSKLAALLPFLLIALVTTAFFFHGSLSWLGWKGEWYRALLCQNGLWRNALTRLTDGHGGNWWYGGLENLIRIILPWPFFLIIAAVALWKKRSELTPPQKEVMISGVLIFCIFGFFPVRRWQVLLPLLPLLCVITAGGLTLSGNDFENEAEFVSGAEKRKVFCCRNWMFFLKFTMYWICAFLGSVAVVLPVTWPVWNSLFMLPAPLTMLGIVPLLGFAALVALIFSGHRGSAAEDVIGIPGRIAGTVLACAVLSVALLAVTLPALTEFRTERSFLLKVRSGIRQYSRIIFVGHHPSSQALFYLASPEEVITVQNAEQLKTALKQPGRFSLVGRNEASVRSMISEAGAPVDLQKPNEKEDVPIRILQIEEPKGEFRLWCGTVNHDNNR